MRAQILITLDLPGDDLTEREVEALDCLADVCFVQTEDGLYSDGGGRHGEGLFLRDFSARSCRVALEIRTSRTPPTESRTAS